MMKKADERFSWLIENCVRIGLFVLFGTFIVYSSHLVAPIIPFSDLPLAWKLSAKDLLIREGLQPGWGFLHELGYSDVLCLLGPIILALTIIVAYAGMIPVLFEKGKRRYVFIIIIQLMILLAALSGRIGMAG